MADSGLAAWPGRSRFIKTDRLPGLAKILFNPQKIAKPFRVATMFPSCSIVNVIYITTIHEQHTVFYNAIVCTIYPLEYKRKKSCQPLKIQSMVRLTNSLFHLPPSFCVYAQCLCCIEENIKIIGMAFYTSTIQLCCRLIQLQIRTL
jgi:hypothetical protein